MRTEHFPSLELCREATELGFPETELWYYTTCTPNEISKFIKNHQVYVCPSVMEILDELPSEIQNIIPVFLSIDKMSDRYCVSYTDNWISKWAIIFIKDTLPDALLSMWIWLVNNWFIKLNGD